MNSQKKNGTEKKSGNSKSTKNKTSQVKAEDQYVVDGAIFKCQYGSAPSQILVANNQKVMAQGKAMAVDKDINFKIATSPFATCAQNKNPQSPVCLYANVQWNKQNTITHGNQNALTESSTMMCPIFAGEISCVFPGQIKNVSVADLEKTKVQTLSNFPLALVVTFPDLKDNKTEQKTTSVNSVAVSKKTVRIDEQITLHAYKQTKQKDEITYPNFNNWVFFTTKELEEDKENKIKKGTYIDDLKIFKHVWSPFNIKLHKPGKYHIEACGDKTLEKYEKLDPNSPLKTENNKTTPPFYKDCEEVVDVVEQNRITRILKDGKETTDSIVNVKQGATTVFYPTFLLDFDSNFEDLSCTVEKGNGESVDEGDYSFDVDKKTLSLTPSAGEVNYKITFSLHKKTDEGVDVEPFNEKSISVRSYNEAVLFAYVPTSASKDKPNNNVTLKRPQEGLAFTVKLKDKKDGDFSQVEWRLKKDDIYVDEPFKTKGETALYFFREEGKYEIEADLTNTSYCNGGVTGTGVQKTSGDITQKIISHKFEISNNYVTDITLNSNNGRRYVGVKYRIDPKFLFGDGTFATERNSVEYKADGADKDCLRQGIFRVDKPGEYKIVATLNGKSFESQAFKIEEAEIKKWEFCDVDNKKIDKIGRNNKFGINASVPAWGATEENSKRTVNVSLYCQKKELCAFKTELDKDGNFHVDNIDVEKDIFEKIANKNIPHDGDKDLILTFVVFDSPSRIVKNLSRTERMGLFSKHTNLCVKSRPSVDGYFAESNGKRLVKMLTYDDKATARIQVLNYSNERLKNLRFCLYENKRGMDSVIFKSEDFKPDDSGIVEISIPLNEGNIKEEDHGDSKLPRLFYFRILETSGTCDYYLSKFPIVDGLYQIYSYPQTPGDLYGYDIQQKMSSIQDEALTEMSANLSGKNYNSETLNNTRCYYYQLKIAAKTEESKKYVNSYNSLAPVVVGEDWEKEEETNEAICKCPNCNKDITLDEIKSICSKKDKNGVEKCFLDQKQLSNIEALLPYLNKYRGIAHINTCMRKAHFIAQVFAETKFYKFEENDFTFSSKYLIDNASNFQTPEGKKKAKEWGYDAELAAKDPSKRQISKENQINIANWRYMNMAKNGNFESGDGYRFRGRGMIHLTHRGNYKEKSDYCNKIFLTNGETKTDWENHPEEVANNLRDVVLSALCFWRRGFLNQYADYSTEECGRMLTKKINNNADAWNYDKSNTREPCFIKAAKIFKVDDCQKNIGMRGQETKTTDTFDHKLSIKENQSDIAIIDVIVPSSRNREGVLVVFDNSGIRFKTYCLCRGKHRDREKTNGDTPTGLAKVTYDRSKHANDTEDKKLSYGINGCCILESVKLTDLIEEPQRSEILNNSKLSDDEKFGLFYNVKNNPKKGCPERDFIFIHSGHTTDIETGKAVQDYREDKGRLMPTQGCVRVYNKEMAKLGTLCETLKKEGKTVYLYVEDYDGDITDVFDHYCLDMDYKDVN